MAPFQNPELDGAGQSMALTDEMVTRVGTAAGRVARIQQEYAMQAEAQDGSQARESLAEAAREAAEDAIDEQGISIEQYNAVLTAAESDQDLERRLIDAARQVL